MKPTTLREFDPLRRALVGSVVAFGACGAAAGHAANRRVDSYNAMADFGPLYRKLRYRSDDGALYWWLSGTKYGQIDNEIKALHGLDFTALALANVYGPRQDPHGEAGVVAIFAGLLLSGTPCKIFGTGAQTRDFVYVDDVARAFALAAGRGDGYMVNIGTGVETSVNELHAAMAAAVPGAAAAVHAPARAGELDRSALSISRAGAVLGWVPEVDLAEGCRRVLAWFREHKA